MKTNVSASLRWVPWVLALVALVSTCASLLGQAAIGADLNRAMEGVHQNVKAASELTLETARALAPLRTTSDSLRQMNGSLVTIGADVGLMNDALIRLADKQRAILAGLGSLNGRMSDLMSDLTAIDARNVSMLRTNQGLAEQTEGQAGSLDSLADLTDESIQHLRTVNRRFAFLRQY
jgi:uncharacterized phage infection (PIP) family protein YhgE